MHAYCKFFILCTVIFTFATKAINIVAAADNVPTISPQYFIDQCSNPPNIDLTGITEGGSNNFVGSLQFPIPNNGTATAIYRFAICNQMKQCLYNSDIYACKPLVGCETAILCLLVHGKGYYTLVDHNETHLFNYRLQGSTDLGDIAYSVQKYIPELNVTFRASMSLYGASYLNSFTLTDVRAVPSNQVFATLNINSVSIKVVRPNDAGTSYSTGYIVAICFAVVLGTVLVVFTVFFIIQWKRGKLSNNQSYTSEIEA